MVQPELQRIVLVTDAWHPQVNGVVTTWSRIRDVVSGEGRSFTVVHPELFRTIPCPRYPEIRLALFPGRKLAALLEEAAPHALHIATEGPLGNAARRWCVRRGYPFTTSFHTHFPRYLRAYAGLPPRWTHRALRWFHGRAAVTLVPTRSICDELELEGYRNLRVWTRGVDTDLFRPRHRPETATAARPVFLYVGRVTREKNLGAFLDAGLPGTKRVIGDGPELVTWQRRHRDVEFLGYRHGESLAAEYADADVFVFPSRTDTFGLVMLEAMACGVPVAAFPVAGPVDVVREGVSGCLREDLREAALAALELSREACRTYASSFSWTRCAEILLTNLAPIATAARPSER